LSIYIYHAVRRNKDNLNTDYRELQFWEIKYEFDTHEDAHERIRKRISGIPGVWRIYRSINDRNREKAMMDLAKKIIDIIPDRDKYHDIERIWRKSLMKRENRVSDFFLLDIDSNYTTDVDYILIDNGISAIEWVKTPNGHHCIVRKNFDSRLFADVENVTVKRDAFRFIERIDQSVKG
jgi:hypothetical protein